MTRITNEDLKKKILKHRTEEEMHRALRQFIDQEHNLHIPPDDEDADIVLYDAIDELLEARKKLAILEPLRNAWFSENAWEEALQDPGKALDAMVRPLNPVETPIRDIIKASAITTPEDASEAANAELYRVDCGDFAGASCLDVLRESVFDISLPMPERAVSASIYRGVGHGIDSDIEGESAKGENGV
jgi:hypothetical protein